MPSEQPDVYFLHIPKTAGTSLAEFLRSLYPMEQCLLVHMWQGLVRMDRNKVQGYRCYTGHFGTGLYSLLDREIPSVTFLRDPSERSMSHIHQGERYLEEHKLRHLGWTIKAMLGGKLRDEWVKPLGTSVMGNFQTRSLGVDVDLNPLLGRPNARDFGFLLRDAQQGQTMDTILERAKRRLDGMAVVGTAERFPESLQLICDFLNVPMPASIPEKNVTPGHAIRTRYRDSGHYSEELIAALDASNEYDRQLYEYADRLLDKQLARRGAQQQVS